MDGVAVLVLVIAFVAYFLPSLIAQHRGHSSGGGIFLLNLFLGWTLVGWVVALVWSASAFIPAAVSTDGKKCPDCAELVRPEAVKCRYCGYRFESEATR